MAGGGRLFTVDHLYVHCPLFNHLLYKDVNILQFPVSEDLILHSMMDTFNWLLMFFLKGLI